MKNCNILMYRCAYPFKKGAEKVSASARVKKVKKDCERFAVAGTYLQIWSCVRQVTRSCSPILRAFSKRRGTRERTRCAVQLVYPPRRPQCRPPQVEAAIQDFWEQRVEDATFTQAEVSRRLSLLHVRGASRRAVRLLRC